MLVSYFVKKFSQMDLKKSIKNSLSCIDSELYNFEEINDYFDKVNLKTSFNVNKIGISELRNWGFDENGDLSHSSNKFFKVTGVKNGDFKTGILLQNEIGTLGMLSCIVNDTIYFLVQLKKEPGNKVSAQLSPTLQATISNQEQVHGGSQPKYLEIFKNAKRKEILIDLKLPEQGNRYWNKFNNNIIVIKNYFEEADNFRWMTLGQILKFTERNDSINSCLRSVLSLISLIPNVEQKSLSKVNVLGKINKEKNSRDNLAHLHKSVKEFYNKNEDNIYFKNKIDSFFIKGVSISIDGREIQNWDQPIIYDPFLDEYCLISLILNKKRFFLLKKYNDHGYIDGFCYGPTFIRRSDVKDDSFEKLLLQLSNLCFVRQVSKVKMSEEGGRFYKTTVDHVYYEAELDSDTFTAEGWTLFDEKEVGLINNLGYLNMEARSLLFLSNVIFSNLNQH